MFILLDCVFPGPLAREQSLVGPLWSTPIGFPETVAGKKTRTETDRPVF
jgi:hypothetical protein